jgi:hypothetical protein
MNQKILKQGSPFLFTAYTADFTACVSGSFLALETKHTHNISP